MAGRIRSIKPEVLDDEVACALSDRAWRLWVSSWVLADDHGNLRAHDKYLAANVWQDTSAQVGDAVEELVRSGRWEAYAVGGQRYVHIRNFHRHQRIDNASKPRIPGPDSDDGTWNQSVAAIFKDSRGKIREDMVRGEDSPLDHRPPTTDHRPPTGEPGPDPVRVVTVDTGTGKDERVGDLWAHYVAARARHGRKTRKREPNRDDRKAIASALKSYDLETLKLAIEGLFLSDWHVQGDYTDIEYALRDSNVEKFAAAAERERAIKAPRVSEVTSAGECVDPTEIDAVLAQFTDRGVA